MQRIEAVPVDPTGDVPPEIVLGAAIVGVATIALVAVVMKRR